MSVAGNLIAHHSEAVDPTLVDWIRHRIDEVVGLDSAVIAILLGVGILLFPIALLALVWYRRRRLSRRGD